MESAMSNSNKPIKFVYLQKLANQSMLNGTLVMEMTKTSTFVFMKVKKSLGVHWKEKSFNWKNKEREDCKKIYFLKLQWISLNNEANQMCQRTAKLFIADVLSNGLNEKVMSKSILHAKFVKKSPEEWLFVNR